MIWETSDTTVGPMVREIRVCGCYRYLVAFLQFFIVTKLLEVVSVFPSLRKMRIFGFVTPGQIVPCSALKSSFVSNLPTVGPLFLTKPKAKSWNRLKALRMSASGPKLDSIIPKGLSDIKINGLSVNQWQQSFKHMFPPELIPEFNVNQIVALTVITISDYFGRSLEATGLVERQEKKVREDSVGSIKQPETDPSGKQGTEKKTSKEVPIGREFMEDALYYVDLSDKIYEETFYDFITKTMIKPELCEIVDFEPCFDEIHNVWLPAYILAVDDAKKRITLIIRGTKEYSDAIIDVCGNPSDFMQEWKNKQNRSKKNRSWKVHGGLGSSAEAVYKKVRDPLKKLIESYKDHDIVFTGHSLGAGTAVLLSIMLNTDPEMAKYGIEKKLKTFAFCPPPTVNDGILAEKGNVQIWNFVHQDDIVPRLSISNIQKLAKALNLFFEDIDVVEVTKNNLAIYKALIDHENKLKEEEKERAEAKKSEQKKQEKQMQKLEETQEKEPKIGKQQKQEDKSELKEEQDKEKKPKISEQQKQSEMRENEQSSSSWPSWLRFNKSSSDDTESENNSETGHDMETKTEITIMYENAVSVGHKFNKAYVKAIQELDALGSSQAKIKQITTTKEGEEKVELVIAEDLLHAGQIIFIQSFKDWEKESQGGERIKTVFLQPDSKELHSIVVSGDMIANHLLPTSVIPVIRELYKYSTYAAPVGRPLLPLLPLPLSQCFDRSTSNKSFEHVL